MKRGLSVCSHKTGLDPHVSQSSTLTNSLTITIISTDQYHNIINNNNKTEQQQQNEDEEYYCRFRENEE